MIVLNKEPGLVTSLVEKPDADKAPSNLASIGRYVMTPDASRMDVLTRTI